MSDGTFYDQLPVFDKFADITDPGRYRAVPDDWLVVVADIESSTAAIGAGRYKQVNIVGAASITSVLNAVKPHRVPFVFGGDGATLCVPSPAAAAARRALTATKLMARREFNLNLHTGVVPVRDIHATEHRLLVARYRVSRYYTQAVFSGGGLGYAEACVKDPVKGRPYRIDPGGVEPEGNFGGLECRWDDIPSPSDETVTLMVRAIHGDPSRSGAVYRRVIDQIERIYGDVEACRPVRLDVMRLARSNHKLASEVAVRTCGRGRPFRVIYWLWLKTQMAIGHVVFPRNWKFGGVDWGRYQRDAVTNTDFRKFDDVLRQILAGTRHQREQLVAFLEREFEDRELVFGLCAAPAALMTCLIFNRHGEHVHFVDGVDGGYAKAATQMKQRLAHLAIGS